MSQYPSAPPPGTYTPPTSQTQYGAQHGQASAQGHGHGHGQGHGQQPQKGTAALGQMFNQAVTTGKPMLNKLSKTISSKLGSKQSAPAAPAAPQHLENYNNYQEHQQQQQQQQSPSHTYQNQAQQFSPQPQQQPWQQQQQQQQYPQQPQQPQQPQPPNAYPATQQSPVPPSNYATPASGHSGQNNYFPQQVPQAPQVPQQPPNAPGYATSQYTQGGTQQQGRPAQGQPQQGHFSQNTPQGQPSQGHFSQGHSQAQYPPGQPSQPQPGQWGGQQTGVVGGSHSPAQSMNPTSPQFPPQTEQPHQQQQWVPPTPGSGHVKPVTQTSPGPQQPQPYSRPAPPAPHNVAPVQPAQQPAQQQWTQMSPTSPRVEYASQVPLSTNSPPPQSTGNGQHQGAAGAHPPKPIPQSQPQTPVPQEPPLQSAPNKFVAELPGELGNMALVESSKPQRPPSNSPVQYQPYQPATTSQSQSPRPGYTIPRRAVSMISLPLADPWRFADATTEAPTREFYMLADLVFDALDRRFEPQNTGMLEASKVLGSWKVQDLDEEAIQLFEYDTYSAFGRLWALEGIPHVMVPCQASLMPLWNFQQQSHSQEIKIATEPPSANRAYPVYMPALNRAGWYKSFFLEMLHEPENLHKILQGLCGDTYRPGVLNQPDVQKRDTDEVPWLRSRAAAICTSAVSRVCQEVAAAMQAGAGAQIGVPAGGAGNAAPSQPSAGLSSEEMALKLQSLKMQQQATDRMNHTMVQGAMGVSSAAGNTYKPNYGSFV